MDSDVINLRDQATVLRRRWRVVVLCVILGLAGAIAAANLQKPTYSATTEMLLSPVGTSEPRPGEVLAPEEVSTQVEVITSRDVATRAGEELNLPDSAGLLDSLTVEPVENTRVLTITAVRDSAQGATDVANAFADAYLVERESQASRQASLAVESLQSRYDDIKQQLKDVQAQKELAPESERAAFESQEQALTVQLTGLLSELSDANTLSQSNQTGGQVLVPASAPAAPAQRSLILVGLALGLLVGIGLAFVRDHFDDAIRDESRLRAALRRPVLGRIPHWGSSRSGRLVTMVDPQAPASEAYRSLSSSVRFLLAASRGSETSHESEHRTLLVTSAVPGEGKTTVASNLAVAAARFGLRVILVDADVRRPGVAQSFGLGDPPGLSDLLADNGSLNSYLLNVGTDGLQVLPGGSVPPNPAELLASESCAEVLRQLRTRADLVVIDSAPVTRVADTRELIPSVDLVLLVVRHAVTRARTVADTLERIRQVGGTVSGAVYNDVHGRSENKAYKYGYARDSAKRKGDQQASSPTETKPGTSTNQSAAKQPTGKR